MKRVNQIMSIVLLGVVFTVNAAIAETITKQDRKSFFDGMYGGCYENAERNQGATRAKKFCQCVVDIFDSNMTDQDVLDVVNMAMRGDNFMQSPKMVELLDKSSDCKL
jgi:hypothetical protein